MTKPLWKTTIVIWSDYNPFTAGLDITDLAREADQGDSYCAHSESVLVQAPFGDPHPPGEEFFSDPDETDAERLNHFYAEIERRQEDGDPLTCASCGTPIPPGETADPCYICGQPLCHFCAVSGPRCRGCADLP
jgi:hypothetical protein